jgi:hypothetical protein
LIKTTIDNPAETPERLLERIKQMVETCGFVDDSQEYQNPLNIRRLIQPPAATTIDGVSSVAHLGQRLTFLCAQAVVDGDYARVWRAMISVLLVLVYWLGSYKFEHVQTCLPQARYSDFWSDIAYLAEHDGSLASALDLVRIYRREVT